VSEPSTHAALDEQGDGALLAFHGAAQLLYRRDRFAIDAEDDVARLQAGRRGGAAHFFDDEIAFGVDLLLLVSRQRTHGDAELRSFVAGALAGRGAHRLLLFQFVDFRLDCGRLAVAPYAQLCGRARLRLRHLIAQIADAIDVVAIHCEDHIAGLHACFRRRAVFLYGADQRTVRPIEAERLRELRIHVLHGDADAATHDVTGLDELLAHVVGDVDRNCERQTHVAASATEDHGVHADHFAAHIEQRPAGVAGIHRHVRLDERHVVVLAANGTRRGTHDARRRTVVEAERRADRQHPFAGPHLLRIADAHGRQILRIDLDHRHVAVRIEADDLRRKFAPVGQSDVHVVGLGHDVCIGQDVTIVADDESRAHPARRRVVFLIATAARRRQAEAPEEIEQRIIRRRAAARSARRSRVLYDFDVHDCFAVLIDERRKIRQRRRAARRTHRNGRLLSCVRCRGWRSRLVRTVAGGASREHCVQCCEEDRK
jgi:hypothetical protein